MEKPDEFVTFDVMVTATAAPIDATIKFRDGHKVNLRFNEETPVCGPYTAEDVESITYYTATTSPDCVISVGTEAKD